METQGFTTDVRRPHFQAGVLTIPSDAQSLRDCLASIPEDFEGEVLVSLKGSIIAKLVRQ